MKKRYRLGVGAAVARSARAWSGLLFASLVAATAFSQPLQPAELPLFGKGARAGAEAALPSSGRMRRVATIEALKQALQEAQPGDLITLAPGRYRLDEKLRTPAAGRAEQRIVLRAERLGDAVLEVRVGEAMLVSQPFWTIENLQMEGACEQEDDCEHALHVVGPAVATVIRNNLLKDFSAHIKINGHQGEWPDDGLISGNSLINSSIRATGRPVTPIDLVAASRWQVSDNLVFNFGKADATATTYGIFMKGAGNGGRIERNLVVCSDEAVARQGVRVGISFGGGGTGERYCRDGACTHEHTAGVVLNNIVAHCSDFGVEVNKARDILVAQNTLIDTAGIYVRGPVASARAENNLLEGRVRSRLGARLDERGNEVVDLRVLLKAPDRLQLAWRARPPANVPRLVEVPQDFCSRPRGAQTPPGALDPAGSCGEGR